MMLGRTLRRALGMYAIAILLLIPALLTACTTTAAAVVIHFTAYYFNSFYAPNDNVCAPPTDDTVWYLYVNIDRIDNSAAGAVDFTYDPTKLQPLYPKRDSERALWTNDLDPYWQPEQITVPAGQDFGSTQVHQGKVFQINYGTAMPDTSLPDIPPILYHSSTTLSPLWVPKPHHVIPGAAQPTNQSLADVHDIALVEAGPCSS